MVINPTWLTELAPHYYETKDRRKQGQQSKKRKARASMLPPENVGILGMLAAEDGHLALLVADAELGGGPRAAEGPAGRWQSK